MTGRIVPVEPVATIGREGCDILLPDPEVSRHHATLSGAANDPVIEDLESTNGTWVNGMRIYEPTALREGDTVQLGNTLWRLETSGGATPTTATRTVEGAPSG